MSLFVHLFYYLFFAQCCFWTLQHRKKEKKNLRLPGSPLCAVPAVALGGKPSSYTCCSSVCLCVRCCRDKRVYLCVAELESDCILLDKGKRPIRALLQRQARGFPWLRPPSQGVHVLQQAQNTLFPRIVFADFIAHS